MVHALCPEMPRNWRNPVSSSRLGTYRRIEGGELDFQSEKRGPGDESGLVHLPCERYEILSCEIDLCDKIKDRAMTKQK